MRNGLIEQGRAAGYQNARAGRMSSRRVGIVRIREAEGILSANRGGNALADCASVDPVEIQIPHAVVGKVRISLKVVADCLNIS